MAATEAPNIREVYAERRARFTAEAERLATRSRRISHLRAIVFLVLIGTGLLVERNATVLRVLRQRRVPWIIAAARRTCFDVARVPA